MNQVATAIQAQRVKQFITRKGKFDAGHRVVYERFKCNNLHGHEYHYELTFSYEVPKGIGYAIDFKEIKRIGCQWIDDVLDHAFICNPKDHDVVGLCKHISSKKYLMKLVDEDGFCNPTAENIAKELFFAVSILLNRTDDTKLTLTNIKLHETVNCFVECQGIEEEEWESLIKSDLYSDLISYKTKMGEVEYDSRRI